VNQLPASEPGAAISEAALAGLRRVFVRDLVVPCRIGVYRHEKDAPQRVRINVDLYVIDGGGPKHDRLDEVVSYEDIVVGIRHLVQERHINLVETMAERLATLCLRDARVRVARIRAEKLDVFPDADSVGVEIQRISRLPRPQISP